MSGLDVHVRTFPTGGPEADGTLRWDSTTAVAVLLHCDGRSGLGWTYSSPAAAAVIEHQFRDLVIGSDAMDVARCWESMHRAVRNTGSTGLAMQALSAVDMALWDLKARLLNTSLLSLLGRCRDEVPIYGSGGFTTWDEQRLDAQIETWRAAGCVAMKIKIGESWGTNLERDLRRVHQLRAAAGPDVDVMVDANGAYSVGQARRVAAALDEVGAVWFEEPVSSDDLTGLAAVRASTRCDVAAGEYVSDVYGAARLAGVLDCLQLDATRCGGFTGWRRAAAVAAAHNLQVSAHCAPALHAFVAGSVPNLRHVEWFTDHAELEPRLVSGAPTVGGGALRPDPDVLGHGMSLL